MPCTARREVEMSELDKAMDRISPEPNSGCWLWTAAVTTGGYATMVIHGRRITVHRWLYEHYNGPVPTGLELDHKCRVRCCVNPDHLEPVTHTVNVRRGTSPWALNASKTHCVRGHEFVPENVRIRVSSAGNPERICLICEKELSRARYLVRKQKRHQARA